MEAVCNGKRKKMLKHAALISHCPFKLFKAFKFPIRCMPKGSDLIEKQLLMVYKISGKEEEIKSKRERGKKEKKYKMNTE